MLGLTIGRLLGGTVIVEVIFALPGMGSLAIQSIYANSGDTMGSVTPREPRTTVRRARHPRVLMVLSGAWLGLVVFMAVFVGFLGLPNYAGTVGQPAQPPSFGDFAAILGTDSVGWSVLARLVAGAQVSGLVGIRATALAMVVGGLLGLISAYFRQMDHALAVLIDTLLVFPRSSC